MRYPYLPVVGFIATVLVLIPLPRQIRVQNVAIILASFWLFGACLIQAVDPIIWAGNVRDTAPLWCDISNYFQLAGIVGLPAATFCICKHLELILSKRPIPPNSNLHRKIFELVMSFCLPCLWLFVFYSFQNARYLIIEDFGCDYAALPSNVALGIVASLPVLLSLGTLLYGSITLYHLVKHHKAKSKLLTPHLKSRDAALSLAQYLRVMAMGIILGLWALIWWSAYIKLHFEAHPVSLESWQAIHSNDSTVIELPSIVLGPEGLNQVKVLWWAFPGSGYIFLLLFSTAREVWSEYPKLWVWFRTAILRLPLPETFVALSSRHIETDPGPVLWNRKDATVGNDLEAQFMSPTQVP